MFNTVYGSSQLVGLNEQNPINPYFYSGAGTNFNDPITSGGNYTDLTHLLPNYFEGLPPITPEMRAEIQDAITPWDGTPLSSFNLTLSQGLNQGLQSNPYSGLNDLANSYSYYGSVSNDINEWEVGRQTVDSADRVIGGAQHPFPFLEV